MDIFKIILGKKILLVVIMFVVGAGALVVAPKIIKDPVIEAAEKQYKQINGDTNPHIKDIKYNLIEKLERTAKVRVEFTTSDTCIIPNKATVAKGYIEVGEADVNNLIAMGLIKNSWDFYSPDHLYISDGEKGTDWKRCYQVLDLTKLGDSWEGRGIYGNMMINYFFPPEEQLKLGHKYIYPTATPLPTAPTIVPTTVNSNTNSTSKPAIVVETTYGLAPLPEDHIRGNPNAEYALIEYAGLESPFCKKIHLFLVNFWMNNKDKVAWVYRHFPLPTFTNEQKLAEATECANDLGGNDKFWEAVDRIYSMSSIDFSVLNQHVKGMQLDQTKFKECLDSSKFGSKVTNSYGDAKGFISGTPTLFFYNTKTKKTTRINGIGSSDELRAIFDEFVEKSN